MFAVHTDARWLPFSAGFFDAVVSIDSFYYYGTDDLYLNYLARFVKPGGQIGFAGAGLAREIESTVPEHLSAWWTQDLWCLHSASWWRRHWERTGIVKIEVSENMPDGGQLWLDWHLKNWPNNTAEIAALQADAGGYIGYCRQVARRRPEAVLAEPVVSVPTEYVKKSVLREGE